MIALDWHEPSETADALMALLSRQKPIAAMPCDWHDCCPCTACEMVRKYVKNMAAMGWPVSESEIRKLRIRPLTTPYDLARAILTMVGTSTDAKCAGLLAYGV